MPKFESKQEAIQQVKGKTNCGARVLSCFSRARLFATLWTVAHQAPLSIGFFGQEHWSGLPCPPSGDLPDPGNEPVSFISPALAGRVFTNITTCDYFYCFLKLCCTGDMYKEK